VISSSPVNKGIDEKELLEKGLEEEDKKMIQYLKALR
jgi:hypothetical protein